MWRSTLNWKIWKILGILSILSDMYVKIKSLLAWIIIKLEINNKDV